jgi:hypothetical protein
LECAAQLTDVASNERAMDIGITSIDGKCRLELRDVRREVRNTYRSTLRLVMNDAVLKRPFWFERADAVEF